MKILVTGGGTGGHIYPALAYVNYVKKINPEAEFLYVGAKRGMETKILPKTGLPFKTLEIQGFKRSLSLDTFKTLKLFLQSIKKAKEIVKEFEPDVVIGTGGYASSAVVYAAAKLKIPTIIHEQNSVPGVTNKFLSRYVDKIAVAFKDVAGAFPKEKTVLVGNPRATEVVDVQASDGLKAYNLDPQIPTVLIFGGSQGAYQLNQGMLAALPAFKDKGYQVLYASGDRYYQEISQQSEFAQGNLPNVSIQPYIDNMAQVMRNCQLLICRAGATSIAEFTALGLPAILIPSPHVTNDQQTKNALSLVKAGAVKMLKDSELTGESLVTMIDSIMEDDQLRLQMAEASKKEGIPDAAQRLHAVVESLI